MGTQFRIKYAGGTILESGASLGEKSRFEGSA